jgi:hypothetical protein
MENKQEDAKKPTREELIAETKILLAKFMLRKEMKEAKNPLARRCRSNNWRRVKR